MIEDDIRIIHGDCRSVMASMPDGFVDAVVTDPPFGVRSDAWDDMDSREFAAFCMGWLSQARRLAPEMVLFSTQDPTLYKLCRLLYKRVRRMIWYKPLGSQYAGARECGVFYAYEEILHCHDRGTWSVVEPKDAEVGRLIRAARESAGLSRGAVDIAIRGKKTGLCYRWEEGACLPTGEQAERLCSLLCLNGEFSAALQTAVEAKSDTVGKAREQASVHAARNIDVFEHRTVTGGQHPCEKPVPLIVDIIEALGSGWQTILDPFAGSGTTLVAALKTGRRAVGIEIAPAYVEIARRRIGETMPDSKWGQGSLFDQDLASHNCGIT